MAETRTAGQVFTPTVPGPSPPVPLIVLSVNTLSNLPTVPTGIVRFVVNGQTVFNGITNTGSAVFVDPPTLGYNIALTDEVYALYT